ncbi:hypothetical protein BAC7755_56240 [Bacillus sp. MN7755]
MSLGYTISKLVCTEIIKLFKKRWSCYSTIGPFNGIKLIELTGTGWLIRKGNETSFIELIR